jgi:hypothetical protein
VRYYTISVLNSDGSAYQYNGAPLVWTSFANGKTSLGALQVEIDAPVATLANPLGAAAVTIWGVPLAMIGQAANFNPTSTTTFQLKVEAGFKPGLPLATAAANQAGVIFQGAIQSCYGNWIGTNQWLRFIVTSDGGAAGQQLNISFNWKKGAPVSQAVQQTLQAALQGQGYTVNVNVSPNLVLPSDQPGTYNNLRQFAQYLNQITQPILGGTYNGVEILVSQKTVTVWDGTLTQTPTQIAYTDLIGQPTWMPTTQVTIAPGNPLTPVSNKSIFQGTFGIKEMRHIGNFRQPDALAWITVMNAYPVTNGG